MADTEGSVMSTNPTLSRPQLLDIIARLPKSYRPTGVNRLHAGELREIVARAEHDPSVGHWLRNEIAQAERVRRGIEIVR
jgi:hypothetical protein